MQQPPPLPAEKSKPGCKQGCLKILFALGVFFAIIIVISAIFDPPRQGIYSNSSSTARSADEAPLEPNNEASIGREKHIESNGTFAPDALAGVLMCDSDRTQQVWVAEKKLAIESSEGRLRK